RWARRNRAVVWSSALVVGLLLVLAPLLVWLLVTRAHEREQLDAAQELAQTEEFYRLLFTIKERHARKEPGWTWANHGDLARAVARPAAEETPADLRSEALACLAGGDLRLKHTLAEGFTAYQAAFSPDGQTLALVQGIGDSPAPMSVRLFDPMTGREWP